AGDDDPRVGPVAAGAADGLAGPARGFARHRAAVGDDGIGRRAGLAPLALGKMEPAAECDRLSSHGRKALRSISPLNTWVAPPRMVMPSPGFHSMNRLPPFMVTLTGELTRLEAIAATAV